jgi:hypothetical protein
MPDKKEADPPRPNLWLRAHRQSQSSIVMLLVSSIEYDVERCLEWTFRPLNKVMRARLFGAYGPVSTFAGKIDLAYALGITTDAVHAELNKIRKIRNAFAHTNAPTSLDTEPIKTMFYKLARPAGITGNYLEQFVKCGLVVDDYLEAYLVRMGETEDLRALKKPTAEEPKKETTPTEPEAKPAS